MIPLSWFLIAWLVLMAIYGLMVLLTVSMHLKFGVALFPTYATAAIFLIVIVAVLLVSGFYLTSVDWSQAINLTGSYTIPLR